MVRELEKINSKNELETFIDNLRIFTSNYRNYKANKEIIEQAINKAKNIHDKKSLVKLLEIKSTQLEQSLENLDVIIDLTDEMKKISEEIGYYGGLALACNIDWYAEKIKGNKERSLQALEKSIKYIAQEESIGSYEYHVCNYSFAVEKWLSEHDTAVAAILEKCATYFFENGFNRSFIQSISMLVIIYTRLQNGRKILELCKRIFVNRDFFDKLPLDVKAISYDFVGLGYMLDLNLNFAESFFEEAYTLFKPIYKESIYFSNFIILHSFIISVKALQGKLEQTWKLIKDAENLLLEDFFEKNLDSGTKKQIRHTLNLNKFYVYSRLKDYDSVEIQDLMKEIFEGSKTLYSDFMLLSEFLLNANLKPAELEELLNSDNFSINRVKHLISYIILKGSDNENSGKKAEKSIEVLRNRVTNTKTTFIENVFSDLLIAQQFYSLRRFSEIYPLLQKYENKLDRIQVLELRIFMEAFIQIGALRMVIQWVLRYNM